STWEGRGRSPGRSPSGEDRSVSSTHPASRLDVLTETWPNGNRSGQRRRVRCGPRAEQQDAKEEKERGRADLDWPFGKAPAKQMANRHRQPIGENHPQNGPQPYGHEARRPRCQRGRCELCLVTHLGEKERDGHRHQGRSHASLLVASEPVPSQGPETEPDER